MQFRIPIYVQQAKAGYTARPLFFARPHRTDDNLNRLLTKLTREIVQALEVLGRQSRNDDLAAWTFCPHVTTHRVVLNVELRKRIVRVKHLVVAFTHFGRRMAFSPAVPEVWFEVNRNEAIEDRTQVVLEDYWRTQEREAVEGEVIRPEEGQLAGKAWVQVLELSATVPAVVPKAPPSNFLMLGGGDTGDGASELRRVGRCLDWLYPEELDRAVLRNREVDELDRLLAHDDRRPVLLCGPRQSGKTTVIHECVFRRVTGRKQVHIQRGNVWLLSPQRLISGMSYVGQWEGRLLAILKHVKKRDHVLYFDDLVGLFLAGITSNSTLNAAVVLKPYLERRDVRVLGEITLEGLRVLQERDRGFADLFHVIPIQEPSDADTLRILIDQQRSLEGRRACNFGLDVLPAVIDLQRRYDRTAAFPGKAAAVLTRLAIRATTLERPPEATGDHARTPFEKRPAVSRDDVLADFVARSGLSRSFLDPKQRLDRDDVRNTLQEQVIGQGEAVEALADVVSVAKARLNDPDRPLAAFLFLGPTGVGKTECAKAITRTLFGEVERMLRFDLNEFNQPGAAARLVGTFSQPEGLLTSAIRRQPFAVILLDEVEKADPEVFDLLLQVLGEGRLTDSLGRTADFTNAIIVLTSNLGVRDAEGSLGFASDSDKSFAYTKAAEKFFRPEFFNRLDRVIPFRKLTRDELGRIARRLVNDVLAREGFGQRQCVLNVSNAALDRVIESGYDPALGARAMKRAVERELTQPAAAQLACLNPEELTIVTVTTAVEHGPPARSSERLAVNVRAPGWAAKVPTLDRTAVALEPRLGDIRMSLETIEDEIARLRPAQAIVGGRVTVEHERYFALKELADEIAGALDRIETRFESRRHAYLEAAQPEAVGRKSRYRYVSYPKNYNADGAPVLRLELSAYSMEEAVRELLDMAEPLPGDQDLFDLENRLALLRLMASAPSDDQPTYLWIRAFPDGQASPYVHQLARLYLTAWTTELGVELERLGDLEPKLASYAIRVKGVAARALARTEAGTHLFLPKHGGPVPVRVEVVDEWPARLGDSFAFGPIVRMYPEGRAIADVRTGLICAPPYSPEVFRTFTLAALPR